MKSSKDIPAINHMSMELPVYDYILCNSIEELRGMAISEGYRINSEYIIQNPGKFEGEHIAILYFYAAYENGDGKYEAEYCQLFERIEGPQNDNWIFDALNTDCVKLHFPESGFVSLETF